MKVLYNAKYGGFSFSDAFLDEFKKRHPEKKWSVERTDPDVIALFEELGCDKSSGYCADLRIEEIPDDVEFEIDEYDGMETVCWDVPKDLIIQDLLDMIKGRKKWDNTSKFTQLLLEKDCSTYGLREIILAMSSRKEDTNTST
jgi:hypothetical protein